MMGMSFDDRMSDRPPYLVEVNQPFHLSGEAERYEAGAFDDCEAARDACREIVEEFLSSRKRAASTAEELLELYRGEGPEPFVVDRAGESGGACSFSAATYAEERCRELFAGGVGGVAEAPKGEPPLL
jgi:hypothetical protein